MQELTKEQKLIAVSAAHTADKHSCALQRLWQADGSPAGLTDLHSVAKMHGFSFVEAYAIMDGWDIGAKGRIHFAHMRHRGETEYDRGFALGKACYAAAQK